MRSDAFPVLSVKWTVWHVEFVSPFPTATVGVELLKKSKRSSLRSAAKFNDCTILHRRSVLSETAPSLLLPLRTRPLRRGKMNRLVIVNSIKLD